MKFIGLRWIGIIQSQRHITGTEQRGAVNYNGADFVRLKRERN